MSSENPLKVIEKIINATADLETKYKAIDEVLFQRRSALRQMQNEKVQALISSVSQEEIPGESSNWISKP